MSTRREALELKEVAAGFGDKHVLVGVSVTIAAGELVALIGPNGAGKTTLLKVATGMMACSAGEVKLFGEPVARMAPRRRARLLAAVEQSLETPMAYTVEELVKMGRTPHLGRWRVPGRDDRRAVEEALKMARTEEMRARRYQTLSSGEQQRVAIAMALAVEPRLLLMDEATAHLDINHRIEVMELVRGISLERGIGVLSIVHDLNLAAEFFPRIILMDQGRIVADGRPEEVLRKELLERVYGCGVRVWRDEESNCLRVFPER